MMVEHWSDTSLGITATDTVKDIAGQHSGSVVIGVYLAQQQLQEINIKYRWRQQFC